MNSDKLLQFKAVADTGSITAAAEKLFVTQPALSKSISSLEEELGCKLFDRIGRKIYLNNQGRKLLRYVDQLDALFRDIEAEFLAPPTKELRICGIAGIFSVILENYFQKEIRPTKLEIVKDEEIPNLLLGREIDAAITDDRYLRDCDSCNLKKIPLLSEQLLLSVPEGHVLADRKTISIAECADLALMRMTETTSVNNWVNKITTINNVRLTWAISLDGDSYWNFTRSDAISPPFFDSSSLHLSSISARTMNAPFAQRKLIRVTGNYTQRMLFLWYCEDNAENLKDFIDSVRESLGC